MKTMRLSIKQQTNRIEKIFSFSTKADKKAGMSWYSDASRFADKTAEKYGLSKEQVCQLISLLSPQVKWARNKINVVDLIEGNVDGIFSCRRTISECERVVEGAFLIPKDRLKTYSFAKCILDAGQGEDIVVDRHAIKIAFGEMSAKEIGITKKRYLDAAKAYRIVAKKFNMSGAQMQAVTWVTYKRLVGR